MKQHLLKDVLIIVLIVIIYIFGQPPATGIYIMDIKIRRKAIKIKNVVNITNREGYDNQPSFTANSDGVFYSSIRDTVPSDIYFYSIKMT